MHPLERAIEELAQLYFGHFGVVGVWERLTAAGPSIVVATTDPDAARLHVPTLFDGFAVHIERSAGHETY